MKKLIVTMMTMLLTLTGASAQEKPQVLGKSHAMQRVEVKGKYLLLPVQEREENANISVLVAGQQVQSLNVKLAVDKVDYYVPLNIERFGAKDLLLDITFYGDRRFTGAMKDFLCWKEIKQSDTFDTTNREKFRPSFHHTPAYGWMNDPNGMFYKDGVYHLYYQWNPYGSQWENMTWGHSTSKDLIHWETQPTAIEADALGAIFSGSCVVNKNEVVAFYTSAGKCQVQSMAISKDNGMTFEKYSGNPILVSTEEDFRDPKAFWNEEIGKWNLVLAVGQEMRIYSSANLKDWIYESSFGKDYGCHDGVWECPELLQFGDQWVLLVSLNPGGLFGGSATQYFVGQWDGHTFTCTDDPEETKWLDYGKDNYSTFTWHNAPDQRIVSLGWMSNWQYANNVPTVAFRSQNTIARDLSLYKDDAGEVRVRVLPSPESMAIKGEETQQLGDAAIIELEMSSTETGVITLSNDKGENVVMTLNVYKHTFTMDRTESGDCSFSADFTGATTTPLFVMQDTYRVILFIDHCSIETFDANGYWAMTNLVFPSKPYNHIKVEGGKATIYDVKI